MVIGLVFASLVLFVSFIWKISSTSKKLIAVTRNNVLSTNVINGTCSQAIDDHELFQIMIVTNSRTFHLQIYVFRIVFLYLFIKNLFVIN